MKINFGAIALIEGEIVHFCGYENKPTEYDFEILKQELTTNEEFGLQDQINNIKIEEAKPEFVAYMKTVILKSEDEANI